MLGGDWDPNDEYDPLWPNEYSILQRQYLEEEEKKRMAIQDVTGPSRTMMMTALRGMQDYDEDDNDDDDLIGHKATARGIAVAPPPSLLKPSISSQHKDGIVDSSSKNISQQNASQPFAVSSVAANIMKKMGYKEGQVLGKDDNNATPGKIIAEKKSELPSNLKESTDNSQQLASDSKSEPITELIKNPTKVILLSNMVGPGEVDDDLEDETKEECSKYGEVIRCLIYEIPNKRVPDDEAVRIFLEFRRVESAIKAVVDLNGRYFGGRVVRASFFDVDKFNRFELAPTHLLKN